MKFPAIGAYIDSIRSGRDFFRTLSTISLCQDHIGEPIYGSGNFGVVFKVQSPDGAVRALKCFTRAQAGRNEAYKLIASSLPCSEYVVDHQFLSNEILASPEDGIFEHYAVLDMEWIEGKTLEDTIGQACTQGNKMRLEQLRDQFEQMALFLLDAPFAHGDLKPENIIVSDQGRMCMIDYDDVYLPQMEGEMQRSLGTEQYNHPQRAKLPFSKAVDNYPIALIALTLRVLALQPELYEQYGHNQGSGVLFSPSKLIAGLGELHNTIQSSPFASSALWQIVTSNDPFMGDLRSALSENMLTEPLVDEYRMEIFEYEGRFGFRSIAGRVINPIYEKCLPFSEGLAAVCISSKWGYIDSEGVVVARFGFDDAWSFSCNRALVRKGDRYGYIASDGRMAIAARYDFARNFASNLAAVCLNSKWGYIDIHGYWIVRPVYDHAQNARDGRAAVELSGRCFLIEV